MFPISVGRATYCATDCYFDELPMAPGAWPMHHCPSFRVSATSTECENLHTHSLNYRSNDGDEPRKIVHRRSVCVAAKKTTTWLVGWLVGWLVDKAEKNTWYPATKFIHHSILLSKISYRNGRFTSTARCSVVRQVVVRRAGRSHARSRTNCQAQSTTSAAQHHDSCLTNKC